ncbi:hypothetical protein DFJ43DRAFT_1043366 [Lentinula guzmanii]|uniref:Uncharacterized protein n=1 Tax=Lentinula guzmanii TaxID=2804957 RepID=A0AA38MWA6_9AGAR|nr:hypothetical protein DFJ43DRAFT_1043366 [Lentinula guzmanii]
MSPTPSRPSSSSDDEEKAEELRLQKKKEERIRREAARKAEEEEEAAAEAQLAEIRRKKEEKKKREAEERKKKEEEERKKREEEEERVKEEECRRKDEERLAKEKEEKEEKNRAKSVGALVQASIARRGKENHPIDVDSPAVVGKKRKRTRMIASNSDPKSDDPNPGDDGFEVRSLHFEEHHLFDDREWIGVLHCLQEGKSEVFVGRKRTNNPKKQEAEKGGLDGSVHK